MPVYVFFFQAINVEYDDDADDFHHFSGMMKK